MSYYFDDLVKVGDIDFENILLNENSHENMIYEISKNLRVAKLCVWYSRLSS